MMEVMQTEKTVFKDTKSQGAVRKKKTTKKKEKKEKVEERGLFDDLLHPTEERPVSSGYQSIQQNEESYASDESAVSTIEESDVEGENEFQGECALDIFIDPLNPYGKEAHPTLQSVIQKQNQEMEKIKRLRAEKRADEIRRNRMERELRKLERRLHSVQLETKLASDKNRDINKQIDGLKARDKAAKDKIAKWRADMKAKIQAEKDKSKILEEECAELRAELSRKERERMDLFNMKIEPIIIRDGPSSRTNHKMRAKELHYQIYPLSQRKKLFTMRADHEETKRKRVQKEVWMLRDRISELHSKITKLTKGVPISKTMLDQISHHRKRWKKIWSMNPERKLSLIPDENATEPEKTVVSVVDGEQQAVGEKLAEPSQGARQKRRTSLADKKIKTVSKQEPTKPTSKHEDPRSEMSVNGGGEDLPPENPDDAEVPPEKYARSRKRSVFRKQSSSKLLSGHQ